MKTKEDIINFLIKKFGYKKYLEIGVQNSAGNFSKVNAEYKIGIDPDPLANATYTLPSDTFFDINKEEFDIILIDGLHEHKQVYRDIENSLKILSKGGTIIMHDCNPTSNIMQKVPREVKEWTGDTWKAYISARMKYFREWHFRVVNIDYGVGVIDKLRKDHWFEPDLSELKYSDLEKNRKEWLNLITVDEFVNEFK